MHERVYGPDVVSDTQELETDNTPRADDTPSAVRDIIEEGARNCCDDDRLEPQKTSRDWLAMNERLINVGLVVVVLGVAVIVGIALVRSNGSENSSTPAASEMSAAVSPEGDAPAVVEPDTAEKMAAAEEEVVMNFDPELSLEVVHGDLLKLHASLVEFQPFVQKLSDRTDALEEELASVKANTRDSFVRYALITLAFLLGWILTSLWLSLRNLRKALAKVEEDLR